MRKAGIKDYEVFARDILQTVTAKPISLEVLADALWGPIFHRLLVSRMPIDGAYVGRLLDLVLGRVAARR